MATLEEQIVDENSFQQEYLDKPKVLEKYDLLAIIDAYARAKTKNNPDNPEYERNELAVHIPTNNILVYVLSRTKAGITKFKKDFPDAEIKESAILENPQEWRQLGFPAAAVPDSATPLDAFFYVHGRQARDEKDLLIVKEELEN
jgi:hypothetical protein